MYSNEPGVFFIISITCVKWIQNITHHHEVFEVVGFQYTFLRLCLGCFTNEWLQTSEETVLKRKELQKVEKHFPLKLIQKLCSTSASVMKNL